MSKAAAVFRYRKFAFIFLLGAVLTPAARVALEPTPDAEEISVSAYAARLDQLARQVSESKRSPAEISNLRESLPSVWEVRTHEGAVQVSPAWLNEELAALERNPAKADPLSEEIHQRLDWMRAQALELDRIPHSADTAHARPRLEEIFKGREYRGLHGPTQMELLLARFSRWIERQILRLLPQIHMSHEVGDTVMWIVLGLGFCALGYMVWRLLSGLSRASELQPVEQSVPTKTRQWVQDALAAAERGDYREAVHCAYWAAIARLEAMNLLVKDRARTPRESLGLMSAHPHEQALLGEMTSHFELIWYGYRPASATDWSRVKEQLERMECLTVSMPATANS